MPCLCGATVKLGGGEIGHFLCLLERRHDEHPMSPPLSITCLFGSSEGGRGLVICSAVPGRRVGDYPLSPPSSHYTNVWFFRGGGGGVVGGLRVFGAYWSLIRLLVIRVLEVVVTNPGVFIQHRFYFLDLQVSTSFV